MTQRTDLERVLDRWLADGPIHVPDRVFDDAVAAVYRAPQRSPWRLRWRNLTVTTRLLAAAIALVAVAGVGLLIMVGTPTPAPTPSPSVEPSATPAPTDVAATDASNLCRTSEPECMGPLEPGTHRTSAVLSPVVYAVPEGWSKRLDVPGAMNLIAGGTLPNTFIAVWPDWQVMDRSSCANRPEAGLGRGVEDLLAFLVDHPGLIATEPEPLVLGGLPGVVLDIRRDPEWSGPCTNAVNLFTHQGTINDIGSQDLSGDRVNRMWLLDGPNGHITNVAIEAPNSEAFDAFVEIAMPVIESFRFQREKPCVDGSACTGPLLPGFHRTWAPLAAPFGYTVPEGWQNSFNTSFGYVLAPASEDPKPAHGIFVFLDLYAANQAVCVRTPEPDVGRTAADLVGWLGSLPDLSMSEPQQVTVGGLEGFTYDVEATSSGPVCGAPDYMLWVADAPSLWWGMTPGSPERHFVLDRPDGRTVFIIVAAPSAEFEPFATDEAGPIVDSFDFTQ